MRIIKTKNCLLGWNWVINDYSSHLSLHFVYNNLFCYKLYVIVETNARSFTTSIPSSENISFRSGRILFNTNSVVINNTNLTKKCKIVNNQIPAMWIIINYIPWHSIRKNHLLLIMSPCEINLLQKYLQLSKLMQNHLQS